MLVCNVGIARTNLRIMERDLAYSLSKERTTARLYIMCYTEAVNKELTEVPVKDVLNRFAIVMSLYLCTI